MPSAILSGEPLTLGPSAELAGMAPDRPGRLLVLYGRLLGLLLAGYLIFDKAFAYIHLPGSPLYVGELVLLTGGLGVLAATGYLRAAIADAPVLAMLGAFFGWGFLRFLPGVRAYGLIAVRDFALVYYCLFAFFTAAALARSPGLLSRWMAGFDRLLPWLLAWLPVATILGSVKGASKPDVPFSAIPVLTHAPATPPSPRSSPWGGCGCSPAPAAPAAGPPGVRWRYWSSRSPPPRTAAACSAWRRVRSSGWRSSVTG